MSVPLPKSAVGHMNRFTSKRLEFNGIFPSYVLCCYFYITILGFSSIKGPRSERSDEDRENRFVMLFYVYKVSFLRSESSVLGVTARMNSYN